MNTSLNIQQMIEQPRRRVRTITVIAALALTGLALTACSSGAATTSSNAAGSASKGGKIVLIAGVKSAGFYQAMACSAAVEAKKLGYNFSWTAPDTFNATAQTPIVEAITAQHPKAVIMVPTDAVAMTAPIKQMEAAGIKVVLADTSVTDPSVGLSRISTDNVALGRQAADSLAKLIGEKGTVFVENDKPGATATDQRAQGFLDEIKKYPGIINIGVQYYKDDSALAASIVTTQIAAHPDLAGIFSEDYRATQGIATGLKTVGAVGRVKVVGADADPDNLNALRSNAVQALIVQKPTEIGASAIDQLNSALTGKAVTKQVNTGTVIATQENMTDPSISQFFYKGC